MRILDPILIGGVEIPNRVVRTAHGTFLAVNGIDDDFINYHLARAKGGCGLTILETATVHPSSGSTMRLWDDSLVPGYRRLMDAVRPHGMRVFQQLYHGGHNFPGVGGLTWSASNVTSPWGSTPIAMKARQIREIIDAFALAAQRCRDGGLDGVEVHGAHGYLFHQFLSRLTNHRDDDYGGPIENRMRLLLEVMRAVRAYARPGFAVGVRLSVSEVPGGVTQDDCRAVTAALEAENLVDFIDLSLGDYFYMPSMNATMERPTGYELPSVAPVAATVRVPRIVAGRFRTLEEADQVIRDGTADMVSMVRAQIADPDLVRKTREGRASEVRPCIACNQGCIGGLFRNQRLGCLVNPAVGFEAELSEDLWTATDTPRRVLVVGGGPAGLEAARVAAHLGHEVTLAEASANLGGTVNIARRAPFLHTLGDITHWLEQEVYRLGVDVRLGTYMDAQAVRAEAADVVILATGSLPKMDGIQTETPWIRPVGVDLPHVLSSTDLLTAPPLRSRSAVVLDDVGHYEAIAAVDALLARNIAVTLVTRHAQMTPYVQSTQRTMPALKRFLTGDFTLMTHSGLTAIGEGTCTVQSIFGGPEKTVAADHVVLITPNASLDELYDTLEAEVAIVRIGDCLSPRDVQAAIAEGRRAAMGIAAMAVPTDPARQVEKVS